MSNVLTAGAVEILRDCVQRGKLLHLATSASDQPSGTPVWYAADDALNLYFVSKVTREHSQDVADNPKVGGDIVPMDVLSWPGQKVQGVKFKGTIAVLDGADLSDGFEIYSRRWAEAPAVIEYRELVAPDSIDRLYRVHVYQYVLFDQINFVEPRQVLTTW